MDEAIKKRKTEIDPKKNDSDFHGSAGQENGAPINWEAKQTEYDSGPKMGID